MSENNLGPFFSWHRNTQQNDTKPNGTQNNGSNCDTQHTDTEDNDIQRRVMLRATFFVYSYAECCYAG
jgi:hypothetical protein